MIEYQLHKILPDDAPGPWSDPVSITYEQRDVLLYAVGIGCTDLRHVWEGDAGFAVFPSFPIRWGGRAIKLDEAALPPSPGPLTIDAERHLMQLAPLPVLTTRPSLLSLLPLLPLLLLWLSPVSHKSKATMIGWVRPDFRDFNSEMWVEPFNG